ncbi:MAG: IMP dehydrogenase [Candidatus Korarchaeota archaeon]|nr:IMP dehydrogenase [Thermoproteota archaeon]
MWEKVKSAPVAISFEDIIVLPGFSEVEPFDIDTTTRFSRNIKLSIPLVSAPMDFVSNDKVASILAAMGGIGVIHRNCSIDEQLKIVRRVKECDVYKDIPSIKPDCTLRDTISYLKKLEEKVALIIDDNNTIGIVKLCTLSGSVRVSELTTISEVLDEVRKEQTVSKLININEDNILIEMYSNTVGLKPSLDSDEKLMVAAACSPFDYSRLKVLNDAADAIVIDVAHFHTKACMEAVKRIESEITADLIIGNIGTYNAVKDALSKLEKVDGFRVGIGSGSICKTGEETGVSAPTLFAIIEAKNALRELSMDIPLVADGGVTSVASALKALVLGADSIMCGRYLAGCLECPGPLLEIEGRKYKLYRGMGSLTARLERLLDRYSRTTKLISEGVEALVPYQGSVIEVIHKFVGSLKVAMGYAGAKNISEVRNARIALLTPNTRKEIAPHSVIKIDSEMFWELLKKQ